MHISEGVLSPPVLIVGAAITVAGVAVGLRQTETQELPKVAVLSSAFFVASLIHVPIGPTNMHLVLNGLTGLILGWSAFPAILVGLTLQAILFQFGGITVLGVNTLNMALPALLCYYLFSALARSERRKYAFAGGFLAGMSAVLLSGVLIGASLVFTGESFLAVAQLAIAAHIPIMIVEGVLTGFCILFLKRVKPEMLEKCR